MDKKEKIVEETKPIENIENVEKETEEILDLGVEYPEDEIIDEEAK